MNPLLTPLFYAGALFIPFIPNLVKTKIEFIDIVLLYFLYIDVSLIFFNQFVNYIYLVNSIILLYSIKSLFMDHHIPLGYFKKVNFIVYSLLAIVFLFPFLHGENVDKSTRFLSVVYSSMILLPIALYYYSSKGDIRKLLHFHYYFILIWCAFVLIASINKLGGAESEQFGGTFFYYGRIARRGGITYISFALLLVPLMIKFLKKRERIILLICVGFIFATFLTALKRFVFVVIALAVLNYIFKKRLSLRVKVGIIVVLGIFLILIFSSSGMKQVMSERIAVRGGVDRFSIEAAENDIRIDEPIFVFEYMLRRDTFDFLFGIETDLEIEINDPRVYKKRTIHNEYAMMFLKFGILGVILYLLIFLLLYRRTFKLKKMLARKYPEVNEYWIVFQNLLVIFVIEGMVGGHTHPTFRGMILVYCAAIAGHFYKLYTSNAVKNA